MFDKFYRYAYGNTVLTSMRLVMKVEIDTPKFQVVIPKDVVDAYHVAMQ